MSAPTEPTGRTSPDDASGPGTDGARSALVTYTALYRRAARLVALTGLVVAVLGVAAGALLAGGPGLRGGLIGGGTVLLLSAVSVGILLVPWDRRPLLAGLAPMVSFLGKLVVVGVVVLAFAHRTGFSHLTTFVVIVVGVLASMVVESAALASRRAPVVEPGARLDG